MPDVILITEYYILGFRERSRLKKVSAISQTDIVLNHLHWKLKLISKFQNEVNRFILRAVISNYQLQRH